MRPRAEPTAVRPGWSEKAERYHAWLASNARTLDAPAGRIEPAATKARARVTRPIATIAASEGSIVVSLLARPSGSAFGIIEVIAGPALCGSGALTVLGRAIDTARAAVIDAERRSAAGAGR